MRAALALARSCHPGPTVAVTLVGALLAVAAGRGAGAALVVGVAVLVGQLAIGWLNDGLDAEKDRATGRTDKPVAGGAVGRRTVLGAAAVAAVLAVPLSFLAGGAAGWWHLLFVASGLVYDAGVKATAASGLPYLVGFGALPAFVVAPAGPVPWWLVAAGALLGGGAHLANALPDLEDDLATGVRGLPQRLGPRRCAVGAAVLLLAASLTLAAGLGGLVLGAAVVLVAGVALAVGLRAGRAALFRAVVVVALLDVVLLVLGGSALR
ncbi:hypothetical protein GCM10027047_09460 [Rhodococcus aerolatus]